MSSLWSLPTQRRVVEPGRAQAGRTDRNPEIDFATAWVEAEDLAAVVIAPQPDVPATNDDPLDIAIDGVCLFDLPGGRQRCAGVHVPMRS